MGDVITEGEVSLRGVPVTREVRLNVLRAFATGKPMTRISSRRWRAALMVFDLVAGVGATLSAIVGRFGVDEPLGPSQPYVALIVAGPLVWLLLLTVSGAYDERRIGSGAAEFGRITTAALWMLAAIVGASYVSHSNLSRAVTAVTVLAAFALSMAVHLLGRLLLRWRIRGGGAIHRAVVVGRTSEVRGLVDHIERVPRSGLKVVGVCLAESDDLAPATGCPVEEIIQAARNTGADTIAVAASGMLSGADLRRLAWDLEGTGIRLLVAPGVTELAGPRLQIHPIGGLPLLRVKDADFSGPRWALKSVLDRVGALVLTVALSPLLAAIALAVRLTSPGPILFRQSRVGLRGRDFDILKFRTMREGAEAGIDALRELNEHDGVLFKIRRDPRITPVGRFLRRSSLDELPQLFNVLGGSMSLIGPRPPLRREVERYPADLCRRRLLVKPGMTGLWQVSGRAELSWEESVRLDLQYVENWSVLLDAEVLWKTFRAVVSGRGAY
jgi:exopolysaccharide biosynthesis polyprenyl glycosylphosphotransferase